MDRKRTSSMKYFPKFLQSDSAIDTKDYISNLEPTESNQNNNLNQSKNGSDLKEKKHRYKPVQFLTRTHSIDPAAYAPKSEKEEKQDFRKTLTFEGLASFFGKKEKDTPREKEKEKEKETIPNEPKTPSDLLHSPNKDDVNPSQRNSPSRGHIRSHSIANVDHKGFRSSLEDLSPKKPALKAKPDYFKAKPVSGPNKGPIHKTPQSVSLVNNMSEQFARKVIQCQCVIRTHLAKKRLKKRKDQNSQRRHTIKEILQVERSYVDVLEFIINSYMYPLQKTDIIDAKEQKALFSDILTIYGLSKGVILQKLERRIGSGEVKDIPICLQIGDIFCEMAILLKSYSAYVSNFNFADHLAKKA